MVGRAVTIVRGSAVPVRAVVAIGGASGVMLVPCEGDKGFAAVAGDSMTIAPQELAGSTVPGFSSPTPGSTAL
jgi:hypothetical protein